MLFRFLASLILLTGISIIGITLEKQNLAMKREISLQHYELHHLQEQRSRLFLETQQLGAPPRLLREWKSSSHKYAQHETKSPEPATPLLEWRLQRHSEGDNNE